MPLAVFRQILELGILRRKVAVGKVVGIRAVDGDGHIPGVHDPCCVALRALPVVPDAVARITGAARVEAVVQAGNAAEIGRSVDDGGRGREQSNILAVALHDDDLDGHAGRLGTERAVGLELTGLCILVFGDLVPIDCAAGVGAVVTDSDHAVRQRRCDADLRDDGLHALDAVGGIRHGDGDFRGGGLVLVGDSQADNILAALVDAELGFLLVRIADHGIAALGLTDQLPVEARDALIQRVDRGFGLEIGNGRIADNGRAGRGIDRRGQTLGRFADNESLFDLRGLLAVADGQGDDILASCADVELRCRSGIAAQERACALACEALKGPQIGQAAAGIAVVGGNGRQGVGHDGLQIVAGDLNGGLRSGILAVRIGRDGHDIGLTGGHGDGRVGLIVLHIDLADLFAVDVDGIEAVLQAGAAQSDVGNMACSGVALDVQLDGAAVHSELCAGDGVLRRFDVDLLVEDVDALAETVSRDDRVGGLVCGDVRAVAIQAEDRIVHDVCADAQQGAVQALVAFAGEVLPAVVHDAGAAVVDVHRAVAALIHVVAPGNVADILVGDLAHVDGVEVGDLGRVVHTGSPCGGIAVLELLVAHPIVHDGACKGGGVLEVPPAFAADEDRVGVLVPGGLDAAHRAGLVVGHAHGTVGVLGGVAVRPVLRQGLDGGEGALFTGVVVGKLGAVRIGGVDAIVRLVPCKPLLQVKGLLVHTLGIERLDHVGDLLLAVEADGAGADAVGVDAVGLFQIPRCGLTVLDEIRISLDDAVHVEEAGGLHHFGERTGVRAAGGAVGAGSGQVVRNDEVILGVLHVGVPHEVDQVGLDGLDLLGIRVQIVLHGDEVDVVMAPVIAPVVALVGISAAGKVPVAVDAVGCAVRIRVLRLIDHEVGMRVGCLIQLGQNIELELRELADPFVTDLQLVLDANAVVADAAEVQVVDVVLLAVDGLRLDEAHGFRIALVAVMQAAAGTAVVDHTGTVLRRMRFVERIILVHALDVNGVDLDEAVIIVQVEARVHVQSRLEARDRNGVDEAVLIEDRAHVRLALLDGVRGVVRALGAFLRGVVARADSGELELVGLALTRLEDEAGRIFKVAAAGLVDILGVDVVNAQARLPSAGVARPVGERAAGTVVADAVVAADPVIHILDAGTGGGDRREEDVVALAAAADRIGIAAVRACEGVGRDALGVDAVLGRVLVVPRHRQADVAEFQIRITLVLQGDGPQQGAILGIHIIGGLHIEALHGTVRRGAQVLADEVDLDLLVADNGLLDIGVIGSDVGSGGRAAGCEGLVRVDLDKAGVVGGEAAVRTGADGEDHFAHPLMLHTVLGTGVVRKDEVDFLIPAVTGVIHDVERRNLSEITDRNLQTVICNFVRCSLRRHAEARQDAGEQGRDHDDGQHNRDHTSGQVVHSLHEMFSPFRFYSPFEFRRKC